MNSSPMAPAYGLTYGSRNLISISHNNESSSMEHMQVMLHEGTLRDGDMTTQRDSSPNHDSISSTKCGLTYGSRISSLYLTAVRVPL
ncbi:hypothetical protein AVEN_10426-1 [Araneus ventricosus]|uniref:Uncharacterized protein n=1 Tax=Araneus ventricosus TaxID=182803 RepID=A0A4Y2NVK5_ARAVE|nr:hypothetical protein AVEN_10426-1 [Araneus ventricosus]